MRERVSLHEIRPGMWPGGEGLVGGGAEGGKAKKKKKTAHVGNKSTRFGGWGERGELAKGKIQKQKGVKEVQI